MKKSNKIGIREFVSIFFRSFLIQAVWNYQSMISIGFCFALVPVAKKLLKSKEERAQFLYRHLNFFNAHPYFSSFALGAITKIEEEQVTQNNNDYSKVDRLKNALIGPLGAIGDQVVWATLKPASILVGVIGVLIIQDFETQLLFLLGILLLYNIPHLYIRVFGIVNGYKFGFDIYKVLNIENYKKFKNIYGILGAIALGVLLSFSIFVYSNVSLSYAGIFLFSVFGSYVMLKYKKVFYTSIILPLILSVVIGILLESL
jgi:mannose/fructose/N-acetylgalactosamine-specific phosphotransferase system component IID